MSSSVKALLFASALVSCGRLRDATVGPADSARSPTSAAAPTEIAPTPTAPTAPTDRGGPLVAFPGAEGFGASARGGRGGSVCRVSTLAKSGPGSLQACADASGPRVVVFDVSGRIPGPVEIHHGRLTIAGQTSPGGVTIDGGLICDNVYDPNDCNDVVVRHVRLRRGNPDSLRVGGAHDVIVDHCSMSGAEDENVEITRSRNVTVQHSVVAEPVGDHYKWGGVLINYSKDTMPLDGITLHHTVFNGVAGRLPELSCEENADGPGRSNCAGHVLHVELANNVLWDASDPIWYNRCVGNNEGSGCAPSAPSFFLELNMVGNVIARRSQADSDAPLLEPSAYAHPRNAIFASDNQILLGARARPAESGARARARHPFPSVAATPSRDLVALLAKTAGAWPRDAMDARLAGYLAQPVDRRPPSWQSERGLDRGDSFAPPSAPAAPADSDGDGMPDVWESTHGTDPRVADGASTALAARSNNGVRGCTAGYTALECYLNELADARVAR